MFRCNDCGCEFEKLARWEEHHGDNFYETMYGCPNCYEGDIEEIREDDEDDYDDEELEG